MRKLFLGIVLGLVMILSTISAYAEIPPSTISSYFAARYHDIYDGRIDFEKVNGIFHIDNNSTPEDQVVIVFNTGQAITLSFPDNSVHAFLNDIKTKFASFQIARRDLLMAAGIDVFSRETLNIILK